MGKIKSILCLLLILLIAIPFVVSDAGVPVIFITLPIMSIALIPIILIESFVLRHYIKFNFKKIVFPVGIANAATVIIGYPLSWGLLLVIELITTGGGCGPGFDTIGKSILTVLLESAWLCPWEDQLYWTLPIAIIIGLVVAFFISVYVEYFIIKRFFKKEKQKMKKAVWVANIISYTILILFSLIYLIVGLINQ